ncbi:threonylcarbamoyl-AMP synthase [Candidatus Roizmanbacteria bacterium]|nr:threonylcarbamoyl-AMP synthase [Candidatus Roizmanbacteria bacterium]
MKIISLERAKVATISERLRNGEMIVSPTDTVYGLLVEATNEKAVKKLIAFKKRPLGKAISVFLANFEMLKKNVFFRKPQEKILRELLPGPFTIVLPSKHKVSNLLESEKGTLGVRIPDYKFINDLCQKFGKPITATSANLSGRSPHYSVDTLLNELTESKKQSVDLIIDAGKLPRNKPSTIIDLTTPSLKILRYGDLVCKDEQTLVSDSPTQTKKIAQFVLKKVVKGLYRSQQNPIIFIIQGDLGVGKTVFVKGIGEMLGIKNIISPTYVVYYEYSVSMYRYIDMLVHIDLYNVQDSEEFKYLHLEKYLKKGNILCIEWGEKAGEIMEVLKNKGKIVFVNMRYVDEKRREIEISY